jgi:hypothetical protein
MLAPFSPRSTTPLRVMLKVPAISYSPAAKTTAPVALSSAAWQLYTAPAISGCRKIHDAVSAVIDPVMQTMVRAAKSPLTNRLRIQCARGEHPENNLHRVGSFFSTITNRRRYE